jgi:hypothetical protein
MSYPIGRCPECGEMVTKRDLSVVQLRTTFWRPHFAIGFGSNAPW